MNQNSACSTIALKRCGFIAALENALKEYGSNLVLISDIMSLFLDDDVPAREALGNFSKADEEGKNSVTAASVVRHKLSGVGHITDSQAT